MDVSVDNRIDVESVGTVEVAVGNAADVIVADDHALDITVTKKEYKIVGDEVYIAKLYDDAPQWMKDLVQLVVDNTMETESAMLRNDLIRQLNQFATSYVPLNSYTQSILDLSNADTAMHDTLETLNSNFNDGLDTANSQIIDLQSTKASKTEVATKVIETLTAQLATPTSELGAIIGNLQQTIVDGDSANADSITTLTSSLEGEVDARATATEYLNTYVGINSSGTATGTGILADLEILQKQADGVINTYSNTYDVMLGIEDPNNNTDNDQLVTTVEPYASWLAEDTLNGNENVRLAHIGDVYIKYSNTTAGAKEYIASYKFIKTVVDSTSPYATDADGFTWALIIDQAAQDAYEQALNAYDLADGKRRVFITTPSGPIDEGDLWIPNVDNGSYLKGEIYRYVSNNWIIATKYSADITALTNNVKTQIDSKVDTYYQDAVPFTNATNVSKKIQAGDYWYCTLTAGSYVKGKMYKYVESANGSNYNYTWTETADVSKYVFDLADGKASIFSTAAQPTTYKINDLMIVVGSNFSNGTITFTPGVTLTSTANRTGSFVAADWIKKINDTEDLNAFVNVTYTPMIVNLQGQIDNKVESWYTLSTSDPKSAWTTAALKLQHNGDMWYQTDTKNSYYYTSSTNSWNALQDATALQALANAATAQATADAIVVSYYAQYQDTAPATTKMWLNKTGTKVLKEYVNSAWSNVAVQAGDTLTAYDATSKDVSVFVYYGGAWVSDTANGLIASSSAITNLTTELNNGTTTWAAADSSVVNSLTTTINDGLTSAESKWAYNSNLNIGGVVYQSGFGLATHATDGAIPSGSSEFWIKADKFKLMSASGTRISAYSPFSVDTATGDIAFNGKVSFNNVIGTPTHTSGLLSAMPTSSIAGSTYTATDQNNQIYTYTNVGWVAGGDPNALTAADLSASGTTVIDGGRIATGIISADRIDGNVVNGKVINGAKIYGAYIEGALIKSSWIDTTGTGYMTEWKQFTTATVPAAYVGNFIHNGTELFVDEQGYVRIQGFPVVYSVPASKTNTVADGVEDAIDIKVNIGAYDSYTSSNVYRAMTSTPKFSSTEHVLLSIT